MLGFALLDYAIVAVYLGLTLCIGLLARRYVVGMAGYLVAGRSLGTALSVAAMIGSELSGGGRQRLGHGRRPGGHSADVCRAAQTGTRRACGLGNTESDTTGGESRR